MYSKNRQTKRINKPLVVITVALSITILALALEKNNVINLFKSTSPTSPAKPEATINYNPPTEEEKQESDQKKQDIIQKQEQSATTPTSSNVTPIISDAGVYDGQVEVSGFVPNIIETDGKCAAKFFNGNSVITKELTAVNDATTTRCTNFVIPSSEFSPQGSWTIVLSYSSSKHQGSSEPKTLEVQ